MPLVTQRSYVNPCTVSGSSVLTSCVRCDHQFVVESINLCMAFQIHSHVKFIEVAYGKLIVVTLVKLVEFMFML